MTQLAGESLAHNESVVIDGMTLSRENEREIFLALAQERRAQFVIAWLDAPPALARERIRADSHHPACDRVPALVDEVALRFEAPRDALRLDATRPSEDLLEELLNLLEGIANEA